MLVLELNKLYTKRLANKNYCSFEALATDCFIEYHHYQCCSVVVLLSTVASFKCKPLFSMNIHIIWMILHQYSQKINSSVTQNYATLHHHRHRQCKIVGHPLL